ncbi:MAG: hypothetical protein GSR77_00695 [Desulfurococcales archaeon]|nr:hypothetical protein [Desulfurococcales archaeon]
MATRVLIEAPSHIHVGNPDLDGSYGRLYGTLGFALKEPRLVLEGLAGEYGCDCRRRDAVALYEKLSEVYGCSIGVRVHREIPAHVGLGSTTALYLAIAQSFDIICGGAKSNVLDLARVTGRGTVSALGVYSYMHGGLIYDGGYRINKRDIPPLVYRAHVPERYKFIVAVPSRHIDRIRKLKQQEDEILDALPRMKPEFADKASRIILMGVLPYVAEGDWVTAGKHITLFNRLLGEYWSGHQEGVYCCSDVERIIRFQLGKGALLAGQSSWGPATYAMFDAHKVDLARVLEETRKLLDDMGGGYLWVTPVDNRGARIRVWS